MRYPSSNVLSAGATLLAAVSFTALVFTAAGLAALLPLAVLSAPDLGSAAADISRVAVIALLTGMLSGVLRSFVQEEGSYRAEEFRTR
ncbi:hypothetical protein PJ985_19515 [Streptomyces sp. ACA25]|uniref:hypothetical protein n=1 Tax=Streptomyces sp. ACA25 TaxID=3022596 RepID=UPI00230744B3|nr:hypothetical protein [Streptomyces sp. ACA25]MDB1089747.1 hypothetical protein [Streptomyces sp. ACA25]